jgi:hypothetical protein
LLSVWRQVVCEVGLVWSSSENTGDGIDYGQRKRDNLGELINETLEKLEIHGGEDAFINIKYMVPTYESVVIA